jgi:HK97 family phage portal protein
VILRTRYGGNQEVREYGSSAIPLPAQQSFSFAGRAVTAESATGLPAVGAAIRTVAEVLATLPMMVYQRSGDRRERAVSAPQYQLLHEAPNAEQSAFDFFSDVAASIETTGNAIIQKIKDTRGRVVELIVIDPDYVQIRRDPDTKQKVIDVRVDGRTVANLTTADVIHIRGFTLKGGLVGLSPIQAHRHSLGNAIALQEYQGRFWSNDATPGLVIKVPGQLGKQQANQILSVWNDTHGGLGNAHRPAILAGGADLDRIPAMDAEWVATQQLNVLDVARIFRLPAWVLNVEMASLPGQNTEVDSLRFLLYSMAPRLRRIEAAFRTDEDLFGAGSNLFPEFLVDSLLRTDTKERYDAYKAARQAGWLSPNEIRQLENYPPVEQPGADDIQLTPVGGAPNPGVDA